MENSVDKNKLDLHFFIIMGVLWGLAEVSLPIIIKSVCNYKISGSVMTGIAIFFIASTYYFSNRKKIGLGILLGIALFFKLLNVFIFNNSGINEAFLNPAFGFIIEIFAFILIVQIIDKKFSDTFPKNMITGALIALLAVNIFPYVSYFTPCPACLMKGTASYPLSLYYAPISIILSMFTFPLGSFVGEKLKNLLVSDKLVAFPVYRVIDFVSALAFLGIIYINLNIK